MVTKSWNCPYIPCSTCSRSMLVCGMLRKYRNVNKITVQVDSGDCRRQSQMAANTNGIRQSQTAYGVWETACSIKVLNKANQYNNHNN